MSISHLIIRHIIENVSFDLNIRVHVFETTIRVLGGLLSAHLLASDPNLHLILDHKPYNGELLEMAYDVGKRLLPAFEVSESGIPYAWVNLKYFST